jgi:Ti-type conjugative transfer relaxase TraA
MAICYANNSIIKAEQSVGVLRSIAYAGRCRMRCPVTRKVYDYSHQAADLLLREVLLPDGAPEYLKDPSRGRWHANTGTPETPVEKTQRVSQALWSAVDQSERVYDRKQKIWRFRTNGQIAYRMILAMPTGRPLAETQQMASAFVYEHFGRHGLPAEICIHRADDEAGRNIHAHVTIGTRGLGPDGFGLKARHLLPDFVGRKGLTSGRIRTGHDWPRRWAAFQNHWFQRHGIDLQVDPIAAEPGIHIGRWRDPEIEAERHAANEATRIESARIARVPELLLRVIEDQIPVFGLREILRHLRRNGVVGFEARQIANRLLTLPEIVALEPRAKDLGIGRKLNPTEARLYTTRAILAQEKRIRARVEYLYGEMVWGQPLPAGMRAHAENLIAARGLDFEQAEAVRHSIEGPGIRVNQGVAGAGKTYLLQTTRQVYEDFGFNVLALAPTNLVAADLRKNGFDASTIHRFLHEIRRGKRTLAPNSVMIVDEAGMVAAGLYDELTAIACQNKCRLILTGDDRQLPPIGRGGVYGKIRSMIGDARLSRVRRQSADWMKAASESLSTWDIRAGVEAYAAKGAVVWNATLEDAAMALVDKCGRDLDADPERDFGKLFVYCALNRSSDILNNAIQARIWRDVPKEGSYEISCCRGKVTVRVGDRVQFHETDAKRGLFNGALGSIARLDAEGIHVRLDGGGEVVFDHREFKGWGLGYAGTVHRGQGQTKLRSYVLYDHPYVWNAALTYVALTRHKESTTLFVPRDLAADQDALIDQMSRVTEQPLASDYAVLDPERAAAQAKIDLYPLAPLIPWTIADDRGTPRVLDLNRDADAEEARSSFRRMPAPAFAAAYSALSSKAAGRPADHAYQMLRRHAETTAMIRGFRPASGVRDPNCLSGLFRKDERDDHISHPVLNTEPDEIDVSSMVIDPAQVDITHWKRMVDRIRQLDGFVRDAIHDRLIVLRALAGPVSLVAAGLGAAQFLMRLCRPVGPNATVMPGQSDIAAAIDAESRPRVVFEALRFWRKVDVDDYEPVSLEQAVGYAFSGTMPPTSPGGGTARTQSMPAASSPSTGQKKTASPSTLARSDATPPARPARKSGPSLG